ncbi:MAG: MBL fold metallo-hydrolase [Candidatus Hodarchaeales archaeon]
MNYNDPLVLTILEELKSDPELVLDKKIRELSPEQRFFLYCKLEKSAGNCDIASLETEKQIFKNIQAIFCNDYDKPKTLLLNIDKSCNYAAIMLFSNIIDLEDFRSITKYLYSHSDDIESITVKCTDILLNYLKLLEVEPPILKKFNDLIRFIGIPHSNISEMKKSILELFPEAEAELEEFSKLPLKTIQKYSNSYIEDIGKELHYDSEVVPLKEWLDHETLSKLEQAALESFTSKWKPDKVGIPVNEFIRQLRPAIEEKGLSTIPITFSSFIRPYLAILKPEKVHQSNFKGNIPPENLDIYMQKLGYPVSIKSDNKIVVKFLGGSSIGTMGILIKTRQSSILIDYGMSVANYQIPLWDESLNHLDTILVTHAHLDHIGAIPCLYGLGYEGYVFGSKMTRNLSKFLLQDNIELMHKNLSKSVRTKDARIKHLSNKANMFKMLDNYSTLSIEKEYHLTPDVSVKAIPANHIQGSFAYQLFIEDKTILFSGDVNLEPSALFKNQGAELPVDSDLTILDGTYYTQTQGNGENSEKLLITAVRDSKRVIIPAFSVGRAQEILLRLEKAGITGERKVIVLGMATKVARICGLRTQGYLSDYLTNPFTDEVIITGGGMLGGGYARQLVEETKDDPETTIILCGFLAKNTLGYRLLHGLEPDYKQKIVYTRFSGHSSHKSITKYLDSVKGRKVLVHLGVLTKDPIQVERLVKQQQLVDSSIHIPKIGESISL